MYKAFIFLFGVVFCVNVCVISSEVLSENDVVVSQSKIRDYISADTAEHKELLFNGSELEISRADECKCKNGKCMRKCDVDENVSCLDQTMVCVCNPEFAEKEPGECEFCDCAEGLNCTFEKIDLYEWDRNCICPKGYYRKEFTGDCIAQCNADRPCKNGGRCFNGNCKCRSGTGGVFCEEIRFCGICVNRLEADCFYDQKLEMSYCNCKNWSLFYDYDRNLCTTCPCESGFCRSEISESGRKLECDCTPGYKLCNGNCKECYCGFGSNSCDLDKNGNKVCDCKPGFFEREGHCRACNCMHDFDTETRCEVTGTEKKCHCPAEYQDVLGHCEAVEINFCERYNPCDPLATCDSQNGEQTCRCPYGYQALFGRNKIKGEICQDIDECSSDRNDCSYMSNVKCTNLPGSYKCECIAGYEPSADEPRPNFPLCSRTTKSWAPALIVIFTVLAVFIVSMCMDKYLQKRASRSN